MSRKVLVRGGGHRRSGDGHDKVCEPSVRGSAVSAGAAEPDKDENAEPTARGLRVLLVEDDPDAAESLKTLLELGGHDVRIARDGLAALRLMEPFSPDAAVIDIGLPRMDGFELASHIRRHKPGGTPLLIAVSGCGDRDAKERAREAGFEHYVTKPVEFGVLEALLIMRAKTTSPGTATLH